MTRSSAGQPSTQAAVAGASVTSSTVSRGFGPFGADGAGNFGQPACVAAGKVQGDSRGGEAERQSAPKPAGRAGDGDVSYMTYGQRSSAPAKRPAHE